MGGYGSMLSVSTIESMTMHRPTLPTRLNRINPQRNHSPARSRGVLRLASSLFGFAMLSACATVSTDTSDQYAAEASWPVLYEPGYQATQARITQTTGSTAVSAGKLVGSVQYGPGVVSMSKVADAQETVKAMLDQLGSQAAQGSYIVRGYAVNDRGIARAQQTAHWRAESLYYRLAKAGIPKTSMLIETRVLGPDAGAAGRQARLIAR